MVGTIHQRSVDVWGKPQTVGVHQKSDSVWIALGTYNGKEIVVKGRSEAAALASWRGAALQDKA